MQSEQGGFAHFVLGKWTLATAPRDESREHFASPDVASREHYAALRVFRGDQYAALRAVPSRLSRPQLVRNPLQPQSENWSFD